MPFKVTLTTVVFLLSAFHLRAQVNPIIEVFQRSRDQAARDFFMMQQLKLQEEQIRQMQLQREQLDKLLSEGARLRREAEQNQARTTVSLKPDTLEEQKLKLEQEIDKALTELRTQHNDFHLYEGQIVQLMDLFTPGKGSTLSLRNYLEGLYVIAKFASFTKPSVGQKLLQTIP